MPTTGSRLLLVDGTGIVFRAFFAIRGLSTRDGTPSNAVFGFVRMLHQLLATWKPTHVVVALDGGKPEKRMALLPAYKANRPPPPEGLERQVPVVEEFLDCRQVTWVRRDRQEADDVMATLCSEAVASGGADVLVATSDKDMLQLVGGPVCVVPVSAAGERLDAEGVKAKTGVYPKQIVDWLALVGDSSDNIPGVKGVGPKTAARLLQQFGDLNSLWSDLASVSRPGIREALAGARETVERNIDLVRLDRTVDCGISWRDAAVRNGDTAALLAFYEKMEFGAFARELREPELF